MTATIPPIREVPYTVEASGFRYLEAPSFAPNGTLHFSEVRTGWVHRLPPNSRGRTAPFHHLASDWCNGSAFHRDGRLFLCDVGAACFWTLTPDGEAAKLFDHYDDGLPLRGPNDCLFDRNGVLYFTDPLGSTLQEPVGHVGRWFPDGRVERIATGIAFSNGLALTPDERALIVAESRTRRLLRFAIGPDGSVGPAELFCRLPEDPGGPDGMALAADGTLYVCHVGGGCIDVVAPDGRLVDRIATGGDRPSNCAFRDGALYVTVTHQDVGAIHRFDLGVAHYPLYGEL
jgi:gluconolactonase